MRLQRSAEARSYKAVWVILKIPSQDTLEEFLAKVSCDQICSVNTSLRLQHEEQIRAGPKEKQGNHLGDCCSGTVE